jgi:hypothetical protein
MERGRTGTRDGLTEEEYAYAAASGCFARAVPMGETPDSSYCRARKQPHPFATLPHPHAHKMFYVMPRHGRETQPSFLYLPNPRAEVTAGLYIK